MALNKQKLAAVKDWKQEVVDMTAEWGDVIHIRSMAVGRQQELSKLKDEDFVYGMIMACCCNEDGSLFFDTPIEDVNILKDRTNGSILKLYRACEKVNNIGLPEDEIAKNS